MSEPSDPGNKGFRIEPPQANAPAPVKPALAAKPVKPMKVASKHQDSGSRVAVMYYLLGILSIAFVTITIVYLYIEWTGNSLPAYLRLSTAS